MSTVAEIAPLMQLCVESAALAVAIALLRRDRL